VKATGKGSWPQMELRNLAKSHLFLEPGMMVTLIPLLFKHQDSLP
jgi:hypothetical protein